MNTYEFLQDFSHLLANFIILVLKIWNTKSCAGVSGKSQILFALVFTIRYFEMFATPFMSIYSLVMKTIIVATSYATLYLIYVKFKETYDHKDNTFRLYLLVLPVFGAALIISDTFTVFEVLWTFSSYLEAVAILPQLFVVWKNAEVDLNICCYVFMLATYSFFYIFDLSYCDKYHFEVNSVWAGVIQMIICCYTAAVMKTKYRKDNQKFKFTIIDSFNDDVIIKRSHVDRVQQDKKAFADCDATIPGSELANCPAPFYDGVEFLKMQNHARKDESMPQIFVSRKDTEK